MKCSCGKAVWPTLDTCLECLVITGGRSRRYTSHTDCDPPTHKCFYPEALAMTRVKGVWTYVRKSS
jgi:hypothetical protein